MNTNTVHANGYVGAFIARRQVNMCVGAFFEALDCEHSQFQGPDGVKVELQHIINHRKKLHDIKQTFIPCFPFTTRRRFSSSS